MKVVQKNEISLTWNCQNFLLILDNDLQFLLTILMFEMKSVEHIYKWVIANLDSTIFVSLNLGNNNDDSILLERLEEHVGGPNSAHNKAVGYCEDLMKQEQHVRTFFNKHSDQDRLLLEQGLAFRGHDESDNSSNQGNYLRILRFLADHNEDIKKVTLKNAPGNNMLTAPSIQKDIVRACSIETTNAIFRDVGDALFYVLIDESRDASMKEQMSVVLRYVDKNEFVIERFIGLKHVTSTTAISLKEALDQLFSKHGLSISRLRGQGYDGASNM
ncbi:hypothetical protein KPL71_014733 [Citrus sinensis]|uniref:Uncharacterized protein n=2 Tax=Citrus sinensis TaxID=2711 RepID=A0ACB8KDW3_CITSI|nr:hypothetical protein KPL71_014733 [Citrus sinensis]